MNYNNLMTETETQPLDLCNSIASIMAHQTTSPEHSLQFIVQMHHRMSRSLQFLEFAVRDIIALMNSHFLQLPSNCRHGVGVDDLVQHHVADIQSFVEDMRQHIFQLEFSDSNASVRRLECTLNLLDHLRITVRGTFQALSMDHQSSIIHGLNRLDQQDAARLWIMELSCALWRALFTLLNWQRYWRE